MPSSGKGNDGSCWAGIVTAVVMTAWFMVRHPVIVWRETTREL